MGWQDDEVVGQPASSWQNDEVVSSGEGVGTSAAVEPQPSKPSFDPVMHLRKGGRVLVKAAASPFTLAARAANKVGLPTNDLEARVNQLTDTIAPPPNGGVRGFVENMAETAPAFALPGGWLPQTIGGAVLGAVMAEPGKELTGAALGGGGGAAGSVLARTLGGLVKPTPEARELMERGVTLTPGQAAGTGSVMKRVEEWAASKPVASTAIRATQGRALDDANVAAIQSVANKIQDKIRLGQPPKEAIEQTRELIGKAYDESLEGVIAPTKVIWDDLERSLVGIAENNAMLSPKAWATMTNYLGQRKAMLDANGFVNLTGQNLKQLDSELGSIVRKLERSTNAEDNFAAGAWKDLQQTTRDAIERAQANPVKSERLRQSNEAYRQLLVLEKSIQSGAQRFTPRQLQAKLDKAGIKGTDLNTVADAMRATLPNVLPDSGTAERIIANALPTLLLGGGALGQQLGFTELGAGAMAAGALGSRAGSRFMTGGYGLQQQKALLEALRAIPRTAGATAENEE